MTTADYTCYRTRTPPVVDGHLNEVAWNQAPRSPRFVDMVTGEPALLDTRAAAIWDNHNLYIGFWVEEPFVEAHLTERDSLIFMENDVEVFIDGGDCYYEFEINALNTVYEVFFIWRDAYQRGSRFDAPEFDLISRKALSFGGNFDRSAWNFLPGTHPRAGRWRCVVFFFRSGWNVWRGTHPRGVRWAFIDWDFPGLQSAVQVDGGINNRSII